MVWLYPHWGLFLLAPSIPRQNPLLPHIHCAPLQCLFDPKQKSLLLGLVQKEVPHDCLLFSNWSISLAWLIAQRPQHTRFLSPPSLCSFSAASGTLYWVWNKKNLELLNVRYNSCGIRYGISSSVGAVNFKWGGKTKPESSWALQCLLTHAPPHDAFGAITMNKTKGVVSWFLCEQHKFFHCYSSHTSVVLCSFSFT